VNIYNLLSNILLLVALMLTTDVRLRERDTKGIGAYALIAFSFLIKLTQAWSTMGYNVWLILFLVGLIRTNNLVQQMVTDFREELGFWPFLAAMLVGLVGFNMLYDMVRLLLPMAVVILLILLVSNKKSSQR